MNIMKTNMLLLDNRIRKDEGENTVVVETPVQTAQEAKGGMKALMFQGMQNLMANPELAKEVGVMNDDTAEDNTAKSYGSNVAFQGKLGNAAFVVKNGAQKVGRKFAQMIPAGILMASTMMPAAMTLTGCDDKEYISVPASGYTNNVTVNVDLTAMTAMVTMMQNTLTQMLLQQKMQYEQWQAYMEQTTAWQNQMSQKVANMEALLADMGEQLFSIDNHVVNGFEESNALQQIIISQLEKFMTRDEAISYFNQLCAEIRNVVNAENVTNADIQKAIADAVSKLMSQLQLINENLDTIISNQDRAYEQQQEVTSILKDIKGDTQAMKAAAKLANMQLFEINNSIISGNKQVVASISKLDGDMKAGIEYIAKTVGWSTSQVIAFMNNLGINIQNSNAWNASMIIAAINHNTEVVEQGNKTLEELKAKFDAGMITAEEYANAMLDVLNDINSKVGTLVKDFNSYATQMKKAANIAINELKKGNATSARTNALLVDVLKNQQKAYAMLNIMNQNIKDIDINPSASIEQLAGILKCSTQQILDMLAWLGFSNAQISTMNTGAIINAIMGASNSTIKVLGDKLNVIIDKLANNNEALTQDEINEIISLLTSINQGVENNGEKLDELIAAVKELTAKVDGYAQKALAAYNSQNKYLADIKASIGDLGRKVNTLINYAKNAEEQRNITNEEIRNIKAQINQIIAKAGNSITPEQLDAMLGNYTKQLIDELKIDIKPIDFSNIEEYLKAINGKLDEANEKLDFQAQGNKILLDILNAIKAMDKTNPDYNAKLDQIIELMKNFKFECNCQCDCDDNQTIHEGIIEIIS